MKAYKATGRNMQCREFQFEINKDFVHNGEIELCGSGFHFCEKLIDVFTYYEFYPFHRFFEVEIPDDAEVIHGLDKSVTNKIKFIRELSSKEIKELTNGNYYIGKDGEYVLFGNRYYYNENDHLHRDGGPAIIWASGWQEWYQNDKLHREDGPARIGPNGIRAWYINDKCVHVDLRIKSRFINRLIKFIKFIKNIFT